MIQYLCIAFTETLLAMHILIDFSNDFASVKIVTQGNLNKHFL